MADSANLRRGIGMLTGSLIDELNELKPGLGTRLAQEVNQRIVLINNHLDAQAGHRGPVKIAKQKGAKAVAMQLQDDRVSGVAWAKDDADAVPYSQFRSQFTCDWFIQMAEDCLDLKEETTIISGGAPDCWKP